MACRECETIKRNLKYMKDQLRKKNSEIAKLKRRIDELYTWEDVQKEVEAQIVELKSRIDKLYTWEDVQKEVDSQRRLLRDDGSYKPWWERR